MTDTPSRFSRADLLVFLTVCIWGVNFSVVKSAVGDPGAPFSPIAFSAIRFVVATFALLVLLRATRTALPTSRRDWLAIIGLGLLGNALYQVLFMFGIARTAPASSSLIVATTPVIVALIGAVFRTERLSGLAWLGIGLSFGGIVVVVTGSEAGAGEAAGASSLLGDLLILGSTTVWAIYTTLVAPLLKRYPASLVTSLAITAGSVPLVLLALPDLARLDWRAVPITGWSAILYSGMFALVAGYVWWARGVNQLGSTRTAVYSNLVPVVAALVAWVARGDRLTVSHLIGAAIILAGINLTRIGRQTRKRSEPIPEPILAREGESAPRVS